MLCRTDPRTPGAPGAPQGDAAPRPARSAAAAVAVVETAGANCTSKLHVFNQTNGLLARTIHWGCKITTRPASCPHYCAHRSTGHKPDVMRRHAALSLLLVLALGLSSGASAMSWRLFAGREECITEHMPDFQVGCARRHPCARTVTTRGQAQGRCLPVRLAGLWPASLGPWRDLGAPCSGTW